MIREIVDLAGCRQVVEIQAEVWGQDSEIVPASVLIASAKRGGILLGAFDGDRLAGFVWSMPGWRDGQPTQWSHMLGVRPGARGSAIGAALKIAQRERALAAKVELIEWTFDPLQAQNAHLNMSQLGCTASTYRVNAYGEMAGPLHHGTPTDRLVAEWWIATPHVVRRLAAFAERARRPLVRAVDLRETPSVMTTRPGSSWLECAAHDITLAAVRLLVPVPPRFGEMQQQAREVALAWRLATREIFTAYFARGYRVVDFLSNRESGGGAYVLSRADTSRD
jgi:chorismate synthase